MKATLSEAYLIAVSERTMRRVFRMQVHTQNLWWWSVEMHWNPQWRRTRRRTQRRWNGLTIVVNEACTARYKALEYQGCFRRFVTPKSLDRHHPWCLESNGCYEEDGIYVAELAVFEAEIFVEAEHEGVVNLAYVNVELHQYELGTLGNSRWIDSKLKRRGTEITWEGCIGRVF